MKHIELLSLDFIEANPPQNKEWHSFVETSLQIAPQKPQITILGNALKNAAE